LSFKELNLIEPLLKALEQEGYTEPTPIQAQAIPSMLQQRDILGCAQTGTGKTAAFALPLLQLMHESRNRTPTGSKPARITIKTLVLTPTRELAIQVHDSFRNYGRHLSLKSAVVFGGVNQSSQVNSLRQGIDILVATPGRLLDLMQQGFVRLQDIQYFVLDEADRMLDMGFIHDVKRIIAQLPDQKQTCLFSATMPSEIQSLADKMLHKPVFVEVTPASSTADTVVQTMYLVSKHDKQALLNHLLDDGHIETALVFTRTKHGADKVVKKLKMSGITAEAIHGNKSQVARQKALSNFKARTTRVLVATDIAARGIDIDNLTHVINFEIPNIAETYVHRIGRTGRAGASGIALSMCDDEEVPFVRDIQRLTGNLITIEKEHPYHVQYEMVEAPRGIQKLAPTGPNRRSYGRRRR